MAAKLDIIEGYQIHEEMGFITQIVRRAYVNGFSGTLSGQGQALLAVAGLPIPGATHPDDASLILGQRTPNVVNSGQGYVDLVYKTKRLIYRGGSQVSQITSMTHRKAQTTGAMSGQASGAAITLNYTGSFKGDNPSNPQGVEIHPFSAEVSLFGELMFATTAPGTFVKTYVNKLNSTTWQGQPANSWLCVSGSFQPFVTTIAVPWWAFSFEFQLRDLRPPFTNAWNPEIAWRRSDGEFPSDATSANGGIAMEDWHDTVNFNTDFP